MAYRSEANKIPNKLYYKDLNLTHYPAALDTRTNNLNMKGFTNVGEQAIPDYVMAEYVNAVIDGLMAVQRAIGINPMVPTNISSDKVGEFIKNKTLSDRIASIEGGNLDERYGGAGWVYNVNRPTLSNHNHDGLNGHPGKINLVTEIEGILKKNNIDLTRATGITGSDLAISKTNATTIADAFNDALSKKNGGTVEAKVNFKKGIRSLTTIELPSAEFTNNSNASLSTDNKANFNQTMTAGGTLQSVLHRESLNNNLMYGKYVIGLRVKTSALLAAPVLKITTGTNSSTFLGNEFKAINTYQMVYHIFDHNSVENLTIEKPATASAINISLDSFFVQPIHPAVFDR